MENISNKIKNELLGLFSGTNKIVILGHHNPDGDAIGGSLGFYQVLRKIGIQTSVVMPTEASDFLKWMPGYDDVRIHKNEARKVEQLILKADVLVCIDFNDFKRVGELEKTLESSKAKKILIDHHPGPDTRFDYIFSFTHVSSASEIVYDLIRKLDFKEYLDEESATCIFTGIMTDTLNFSVNSSRTETFNIVSNLLAFGIDKDLIYDRVNNNFSIDRLKLVGYLLHKKMKVINELNMAYIILTQSEMKEFNFQPGDHEGIVNMPLSVKGITTSLIAIEKNDHIKTSFRSKDAIDVNTLSVKYFNGGGHKNAAGGTLYIPLEKLEEYIFNSVKDFVANYV